MASESPVAHPGEWPVARLGDIALKIGSGATPTGGEGSYLPARSKYALVRSQNVLDRRFDATGLVFISDRQAERLKGVLLRPDDVLLNITGDGITFGRSCLVPDAVLPACVNQHVSIIRVDRCVADPGFVLAYLTHPVVKSYIESFNAGGSRRAITKGHIESFCLPLPPLSEQRAVAHILGTLDDKIELNRRMNETLEAMARALFKSWFEDFDPVCGRAEGGPPVGTLGAATTLFPSVLEDSRLGLIPQGWRVAAIGDMVRVVGGSTPSTIDPSFWGGSINFATPRDMSALTSPALLDTERCITEAGLQRISSGLLPRGTVLLSSRAPIGYLAIAEIPVAVNQGFIAMICDRELPNHYVLHWTKQSMDAIIGNANGTTFLEISKTNFRPLLVVVPPRPTLDRFMRLVEPLYRRMVLNLQEAQTLAALRDALLPKLISGELPISILSAVTLPHLSREAADR